MTEYARVIDGAIVEIRHLDSIPDHKKAWWRLIAREGDGPAEAIVIEESRVRIIRSVPPPTGDDVRLEARQRIIAVVGATTLNDCFIKQLNAVMCATRIVNKKIGGLPLTKADQQAAAAADAIAADIERIRARSNAMEPDPPFDYRDEARWT